MKFYSFEDAVVHGLGWYLSQGTTLIDPDDGNYSSGMSTTDNLIAFGKYGSMAIADPKAPLEMKALGPTVWMTANVVPVTFLMWHIDPLNFREGEGLDESYYMWADVRESVDRIKNPIEDFFSAPPNPWTLVPGW